MILDADMLTFRRFRWDLTVTTNSEVDFSSASATIDPELLACRDTPRKLTWQWKIHLLKMYFLLKMGIFQCHVSFQECTPKKVLGIFHLFWKLWTLGPLIWEYSKKSRRVFVSRFLRLSHVENMLSHGTFWDFFFKELLSLGKARPKHDEDDSHS